MTQKETEFGQLQKTLDEAISSKNNDAIIKATRDLINYHQGKRDMAACVRYTKSILPYLMSSEQAIELARNLNFLGKYHTVLEEHIEAEDAFLQALKIYQERGVELGIAEVEADLGVLFRNKGVFGISLEHLGTAISIYQNNMSSMEDNPQPWFTYINAIECCGIIYGQLKQYEQSIKLLEDALKLKEEHGNKASMVSALMNLGVTYSEFDLDMASAYYLKALAVLDESTPVYLKVVLLNNLGGCLEDKGNLDGALKYYHEALKAMDTSGQYHYQAPIHKHIGTVYYKQGKFDEALGQIEKSLMISQKSEAKSEIKDCYLALSDIYMAKTEYHTALDYRVKYDAVKDEVFQQDLSAQLHDLQKKYEKTTLNVSSLRYEKSLITEELKKAMNTGFVGVSSSIKRVQSLALEAAVHKDTRVLITGESGVGKEIVARLIHYSDATNKGRFIDVNCCSIPDTMAESEFFGFVKGSFTGAINNKPGYFEEANLGTLFLDEIGDMPMVLQAKLLRVLETKEVKRLGSNKAIPISFRLVSATNKDLAPLIRANQFRADLLYRINTIEIHIPPLRERKEDIEPLLEYYLSEYARRMNKPLPNYGPEIASCLYNYSFPGNVRELRNMIEKAMIFLKDKQLRPEDFISQMNLDQINSAAPMMKGGLPESADDALLRTLDECGGNQTQAAKKMGISYATFKRKYRKLRI